MLIQPKQNTVMSLFQKMWLRSKSKILFHNKLCIFFQTKTGSYYIYLQKEIVGTKDALDWLFYFKVVTSCLQVWFLLMYPVKWLKIKLLVWPCMVQSGQVWNWWHQMTDPLQNFIYLFIGNRLSHLSETSSQPLLEPLGLLFWISGRFGLP